MKLRPVGAELLQADGGTDMTKLTVAFPYFVNAPKKAIRLQNWGGHDSWRSLRLPGFKTVGTCSL